ncbi:MAG: ABC transporter ATP-binding protein [Ignavibacteriae bacterium]|nr:ABC transporter ATP-binding protein [Ignavibacteria bacterium]MBI3364252.1 ABC transporter ATP-binding protein [Ignavibacteriota bacterium]
MSDISILVKNLCVAYNDLKILDDLNFEVRNGEFIGIIGKSGTGKTTLLNTLAGFISFRGEIHIEGNIGFCFQNHSLFYWMTVAENIGFGLTNVNGAEKKAIVHDILRKIDMVDYGDRYSKELSGGQMQRVALGRAIAYNPKVLLLDEPFSSLDIYTRDHMMDWVLKLISELNITVVMVTHYLDEALVLADRVFVLKEKKIVHKVQVPFVKPRTQAIRYTDEFQKTKQELALLLNQQQTS